MSIADGRTPPGGGGGQALPGSEHSEPSGDSVTIDILRGAATEEELAALIAVVTEAYTGEAAEAVADAHHHIDEGRVMQPHHQHDAAAPEHRIGAAGFRRKAQRIENRRGGAGEMQKGQRHHLRRDHHRQNEEERDETPPAHVGDAEREGHGDAERQREKARQEGGFESRPRSVES